jgi:chemotaxis protein methyltransferase CheR
MIQISDKEFLQFQRFIYEVAGINMSSAKKPLVCGRLERRLNHYNLRSYGEYFKLLKSGREPSEQQVAIDLLTTNETHLFRESEHFDLLRRMALEASGGGRAFRVWSAASSTGEEPYSIAMVLDDALPGGGWEVLGSDISTRVLERARLGHYPLERARNVPMPYLRKYCLRGIGKEQGTLLICRALRQKVQFAQINLNNALPSIGLFDVVFLRNVMIYFDVETKQQIVSRVVNQLREGGVLFTGHSESLNGISANLVAIESAVYRKR